MKTNATEKKSVDNEVVIFQAPSGAIELHRDTK
jgi:hypothetical protein